MRELLGAMVGLQVLDGWITYIGVTAHGITEKNPIAAALFGDHPGLSILLIKVLGVGFLLWLFSRPSVVRNAKTPLVLSAIVLGYAWVVVHNSVVVWM
jgi:hypothetical protein